MLNLKLWNWLDWLAVLVTLTFFSTIAYFAFYGEMHDPVAFVYEASATWIVCVIAVRLSFVAIASLKRHSSYHWPWLKKPPLSAMFLLYLFLSKSDRETLPGDLDEEFTIVILPKFGPFRAWLWYWVQALTAIAYRNALCRWLLVGGGILKLGEWVTRQLRG